MTKPPRTPDRLGVTVGRDRQFAPVCQWRAACRTRQVVMRVQLPHGALRLVFQPQTGLQSGDLFHPETPPVPPTKLQAVGGNQCRGKVWDFGPVKRMDGSFSASPSGGRKPDMCVSKETMAQGLTPRRDGDFKHSEGNTMSNATTIPFRIITAGTQVVLNSEWRKVKGFTHGEVIGLCVNVPIEKAISDGGTYRIKPLDASVADSDLIHDMHRTTFKPMTSSRTAKKERQK